MKLRTPACANSDSDTSAKRIRGSSGIRCGHAFIATAPHDGIGGLLPSCALRPNIVEAALVINLLQTAGLRVPSKLKGVIRPSGRSSPPQT